MHNPFQREAVRAGVRAALAAYLADVWVNAPDACSVTVDLAIDSFGDFSAVASVCNPNDVQIMQESF